MNPGIRAIEDSIVSKLQDNLKREIPVIEAWIGDPGEYRRGPVNGFAVLVRWRGEINETREMSSSMEDANEAIIQDATATFEIILMGQEPKDDTRKFYDYMESIKGLLNGFKPTPDDPENCMILQARNYLGQVNDFHIFSLTFGLILSDDPPLN